MATIVSHPSALPPMPAVARILSQFDRSQLAGFIEVAISLLDQEDGDTDIELNGDEQDCLGSEDDFMDHRDDGPGCSLADAAEVDDHGGGNVEDEGEMDTTGEY